MILYAPPSAILTLYRRLLFRDQVLPVEVRAREYGAISVVALREVASLRMPAYRRNYPVKEN